MSDARLRHTVLPTLLAAAILSGCATQDALNEETAPIKSDLARLEQTLRASVESADLARKELAAARERERALGTRVDGLASEAKALRDQLAAQARAGETSNADLRQGLAQTDKNLVDLAGLARDMGERLVVQDASLRAVTKDVASSADRAARAEQGLEALAARLNETDGQVKALRGDIERGLAAGGGLSERVAGLETRVEKMADTLPQRTTQLELRLDELAQQLQGANETADTLAQRTTQHELRLDELAQQVQGANEMADTLPQRLTQLELRLDELAQQVRGAIEMAAQHDIKRNGKVAFSVVLTEDKTMYPINLQFLGPRDRAQLDDLVKRVKELGKEYHLEIQGHTDNTSVDDYNYLLGKARAEVVKRYLHEQGGIPLGWMSVISYGATQPLDPRSSGNRRIVIQTLVLDQDK